MQEAAEALDCRNKKSKLEECRGRPPVDTLSASEYGSCTTANFVVATVAAGTRSTHASRLTRDASVAYTKRGTLGVAGRCIGRANEYGSCAAHCKLAAGWLYECAKRENSRRRENGRREMIHCCCGQPGTNEYDS